MRRFSLDEVARAQPVDVAKIAATTDVAIATQIATDPDTAPDLGDAEPASFIVRAPAPRAQEPEAGPQEPAEQSK